MKRGVIMLVLGIVIIIIFIMCFFIGHKVAKNSGKDLKKHPTWTKYFLLGYIVFAGCFTFPLWSEEFPLDFMKVYLIITGYGIIALGLSGIYGAKKEKIVYLQTFILTVVGLLCRYFLEFGEHSNTYNFTLLNVVLYILIIPIFTVITYHFTVKLHIKNN